MKSSQTSSLTDQAHSLPRARFVKLRKWLGLLARGRTVVPFDAVSITVHWRVPARFLCPANVRVTCVSGTAWITTTANTHDVVLQAGEWQRASSGDCLYICGMPVCELWIEPAHTSAFPRTIDSQRCDRPDQADFRCVPLEAGDLEKPECTPALTISTRPSASP